MLSLDARTSYVLKRIFALGLEVADRQPVERRPVSDIREGRELLDIFCPDPGEMLFYIHLAKVSLGDEPDVDAITRLPNGRG